MAIEEAEAQRLEDKAKQLRDEADAHTDI